MTTCRTCLAGTPAPTSKYYRSTKHDQRMAPSLQMTRLFCAASSGAVMVGRVTGDHPPRCLLPLFELRPGLSSHRCNTRGKHWRFCHYSYVPTLVLSPSPQPEHEWVARSAMHNLELYRHHTITSSCTKLYPLLKGSFWYSYCAVCISPPTVPPPPTHCQAWQILGRMMRRFLC